MLFRARSGESRLVLLPQYFVISSKSSSNFKKRVTCLLSAWPGPFVLSTCGDIQQPVLVAVCDGGQTSGFCPHQSHHRGVGWRHKRRWAQPVPQHRAPIKAQGTWLHLTANIWERLGSPAATGSLSQNPSSKRRGKNKISGWRRSLDVRNVYTPVSFISFLCTRTHLCRQDSLWSWRWVRAVWAYQTEIIQILSFGWKVNPVHKSVLNLPRSLCAEMHSPALLPVCFLGLFAATSAVR